MIGKTKIAAGVLAAVAVLAAGCGSSTPGQSTQHKPVPAQSTTQPQATQSAYDTARLMAVLGGPEAVAFQKEEHSLMHALKASDLTAARREARHVIRASGPYMTALRATNPEPKWQGVKGHDIRGTTEFRKGAQDIIAAIRDSDPAKWEQAYNHMTASSKQYKQVVDEIKSLTGS